MCIYMHTYIYIFLTSWLLVIVSIYINIYICIYIHTYTYIFLTSRLLFMFCPEQLLCRTAYVRVRFLTCVRAREDIWHIYFDDTHTHMHAHAHTHTHAYTHSDKHTSARTSTHKPSPSHTHIHTCTHTHSLTQQKGAEIQTAQVPSCAMV